MDLHLVEKGSVGSIYLSSDELFIIKKSKDSQSSKESLQREYHIYTLLFENEIHKKHPNIYSIISYDEKNNELMAEYYKGGDLYNYSVNNNKLSKKDIFLVLKQLSHGLEFIHSKKIIHRDIKLENILVENINSLENIKICDFGWACINDDEKNTIGRAGTLEAMCYEMIVKRPYNYSADIWSLTVLIYELSFGSSPFISSQDDNKEDRNKLLFKKISSLCYFKVLDDELWSYLENLFSNVFVSQQKRWFLLDIHNFIRYS